MTRFWLGLINSSDLHRSRMVGRRVGLVVLIFSAVAIGVMASDRQVGFRGVPAALLLTLLYFIAAIAFIAPLLGIELSRRARDASLARRYPGHTSFPILLIPVTRQFVTAAGEMNASFAAESVDVLITPEKLEFSVGGNRPHLLRSVLYRDLASVSQGTVDSYQCVDIRLESSGDTVPLLLAGPFLAINQRGASFVTALVGEALANGRAG